MGNPCEGLKGNLRKGEGGGDVLRDHLALAFFP